MQKHPNEFTRHQIRKFFAGRHQEVEITAIGSGYVVFLDRFDVFEERTVSHPMGRLVHDEEQDGWALYWISDTHHWHLYGRYAKLHQALEAMCSEQAADLFQNVL